MKPKMNYEKYVYWVSREEEERLREKLGREGVRLRSAKGVVCTPLDEINRIASVAPEVWDDTCGRQGSWYRSSDRNGLYLIVSSYPIEGMEQARAARITRSSIARPARIVTGEEKRDMVADPRVRERIPARWSRAEDTERRIQVRWARRFGSETEDYDALFLSHTANHVNFLRPRFFVEDGGEAIPCSIDRTAHLCSCCLELFQVLGADHPKKLVIPCPGACIFARLEPDTFLLVESA